jgi:P27 family predicted phage terminase small subunit
MSATAAPQITTDAPPDFQGVALAKWNEIAQILSDRGDWTESVRGLVRILCLAYAAHDQATQTIERMGDVLESERGFTRNPACLNQNAAAGTIAKLSAQLILSPFAMSRHKVAAKPSANDFDDI